MMIETMESVLGGAGKIIVVDSNSSPLQILDLTDGTLTQNAAPAEEGAST